MVTSPPLPVLVYTCALAPGCLSLPCYESGSLAESCFEPTVSTVAADRAMTALPSSSRSALLVAKSSCKSLSPASSFLCSSLASSSFFVNFLAAFKVVYPSCIAGWAAIAAWPSYSS
jgi:hypothetical protein